MNFKISGCKNEAITPKYFYHQLDTCFSLKLENLILNRFFYEGVPYSDQYIYKYPEKQKLIFA
jgi:hypothetical protein